MREKEKICLDSNRNISKSKGQLRVTIPKTAEKNFDFDLSKANIDIYLNLKEKKFEIELEEQNEIKRRS